MTRVPTPSHRHRSYHRGAGDGRRTPRCGRSTTVGCGGPSTVWRVGLRRRSRRA